MDKWKQSFCKWEGNKICREENGKNKQDVFIQVQIP